MVVNVIKVDRLHKMLTAVQKFNQKGNLKPEG